jgi:hypothetical protein
MTCEEHEALVARNFLDLTASERMAGRNHFHSCEKCRTKLEKEREELMAKTSPIEILFLKMLAQSVVTLVFKKDMEDPEVQSMYRDPPERK